MLKTLKSRLGSSVKRLLSSPATPHSGALTEPGVAPAAPTGEPGSRARDEKRLKVRLMRRHLHDLLEQHADSRRLMRHLAWVERTLRKEGLRAVEALPRPVIDKALGQLESLVQDWSPEGLAELRSRMAVMLRDRPPAGPLGRGPSEGGEIDGNGMAGLDQGLTITVDLEQVSDTDLAAFAEMERSWAGRAPANMPVPVPVPVPVPPAPTANG